jgi:hypothetical protein
MTSATGSPDVLKNENTTISGDYIANTRGVQIMYGSSIFVVKDDKLYDIGFITSPLKVPEMRPTGEKILQSFQLTTPVAQAPNATESIDPLNNLSL